jgi:hypothetical protein
MSKKLYAAFVPLLAIAAFMVVPTIAQAETKQYGTCKKGVPHTANCPTSEGFVEFTDGVAVNVVSKGATNFVLVDEVTGATITCTTFSDEGTVTNVLVGGVSVGTSKLHLEFDHCTITAAPAFPALVGCSVKTPGAPSDTIKGNVTDEVKTETTVEVAVVNGFELETDGTPAPCPSGTKLGTVTGKATGTEAKGSNDLVFTNATGLFLGTDKANISGSDVTVTAAEPKEPVLIN